MSYLLIGLGNPGEKYKNTRHNAGKMLAGWISKEQRAKNKEQGDFEAVEMDCFMNVSGNFVRKIIQNTQNTRKARKSDILGKPENPEGNIRFSDSLEDRSSGSLSFPNLLIAHDDLDLRLGSFKIQFGKGPRLHKGILSVEQALGTKEFWRIRIGIENRKNKMAVMIKNGQNGQNGYNGQNGLSNFNPSSHSNLSDHYNHLSASDSDYVLSKFSAGEMITLKSIFPDIRKKLLENVIL